MGCGFDNGGCRYRRLFMYNKVFTFYQGSVTAINQRLWYHQIIIEQESCWQVSLGSNHRFQRQNCCVSENLGCSMSNAFQKNKTLATCTPISFFFILVCLFVCLRAIDYPSRWVFAKRYKRKHTKIFLMRVSHCARSPQKIGCGVCSNCLCTTKVFTITSR